MNIQDWFPLRLTGLISLQSKDSQETSPTAHLKSINSAALSFLCITWNPEVDSTGLLRRVQNDRRSSIFFFFFLTFSLAILTSCCLCSNYFFMAQYGLWNDWSTSIEACKKKRETNKRTSQLKENLSWSLRGQFNWQPFIAHNKIKVLYFKGRIDIGLEKAMAPHSSTLAWKIPWREEPGRLQSMGSLRVGHDWAASLSLFTFIHWRRKWQPNSSVLAWRILGTG